MLILKAQNVVSEGIPIVYVYQMHQQNGSFAQNVDSEDIPGSTNGVNRKARNNKLDGDRAPPTSTNVLIYKMGWPSRLQFLAPFHISCNPDINKVGNRSYMKNCSYVYAKCIFSVALLEDAVLNDGFGSEKAQGCVP